MIANRAVQLEQMLKEEGGDETAVSLIGRADRGHRTRPDRKFRRGRDIQYYNMRKAGLSGQQALDELSKRYGSAGLKRCGVWLVLAL